MPLVATASSAAGSVLAVNIFDPTSIIATFGTIGLIAIIFAETGLLVGFFFPGDSLLFTAGVLCAASQSNLHLDLPVILVGSALAAILGAQTGYFLGRHFGPMFFDRAEGRFFHRGHVVKAEHYFERFGPARAVVLARFIPIVRTFLNPIAGVLRMPVGQFTLWNIVGGLLWTQAVVLAGFWLGNAIPDIDKYLLPVIALIVAVSLIPVAREVLKERRAKTREQAERTARAAH